jgi:hypothetical protein
VASFVVWRIIRKIRHKKHSQPPNIQPQPSPQSALPNHPLSLNFPRVSGTREGPESRVDLVTLGVFYALRPNTHGGVL